MDTLVNIKIPILKKYFPIKKKYINRDKEDVPRELLEAFRGMDPGRRGVVKARDLWHILVKWGERLSPREVDQLFREANINPNGGTVKYEEFVKIVCAPVPDYY